MSAALEILEREYCPPLEPALVFAIFLDFEGDDADKLQQARELLEPLKQSALAEQETDFDPSGSGAPNHTDAAVRELALSDVGTKSTDSAHARSEYSNATLTSQELSSLSLGEGRGSELTSSSENLLEIGRSEYLDETEKLDTATKEALLYETFPSLTLATISYTLKRCERHFGRAMDELLNVVYFESAEGEDKVSAKGIDAFYVDDADGRGRKRKKGRKGRNAELKYDPSVDSSSPASPTPSTNRWQNGTEAIGFLSTRLNLPTTRVSSLFHKCNGSLATTTLVLLDDNSKKHEKIEPEVRHVENAIELHEEFLDLSLQQSLALIRLTHPSTAAAHEVAKAITKPASPTQSGIQLVRQYAPVNLSESDAYSSPPVSPRLPNHIIGSTGSLSAARSTAFTQASAAHRKGKSDPLMRAAAGYYGQLGRDYDSALRASQASDADALAASQSSPRQLDLHGLNVKDATRISREYVTRWWHGLGDARYVNGGSSAIGSGYRIITGKGTHSDGGRGKLGPAVGRMLVREGWKVEIGSGYLTVNGVAKRK